MMLNNLIQAYALGCLSTDDLRQLRKASGEEINFKDLGKYQNLAALLPSALPAEIPDPKVKEKIARKLYRMKENPDLNKETEPSAAVSQTTRETPKDISREIINRTLTPPNITSERYKRITAQNRPLTGESGRSRDFKDIDIKLMPRYKSIRTTRLLGYLGLSLLGGILLGFIFFYENKDTYLDEISKLNKETRDLNNELITHNGLLTILERKDTRIISLRGTEIYPDGFGKVYINPSSNRAYLYLSGIEPLKEGTYQLWVMSGGTVYSVGLFNTKKTPGYFSFNYPVLSNGGDAEIILTEEPEGGSPRPGHKIHLRN